MLPSWRSSTAVLESEHQIPMKARSNCSIELCRASCSNKVCQNDQHKSLSSSPLGLFLQLRGFFLFSSLSAAGFSCLGRRCTTEEVLIAVTGCKKKHLWHLIYLCPLSFFSASCLYRKVFFKQRLHGTGEDDRAAILLVASSISVPPTLKSLVLIGLTSRPL